MTYNVFGGTSNLTQSTSQYYTLLHEVYFATTQMLEYTPTQRLPALLPHGLVK